MNHSIDRPCNHLNHPPCSPYPVQVYCRQVILPIHPLFHHHSSLHYSLLHTLPLSLSINHQYNHLESQPCCRYLIPVFSRQYILLTKYHLDHRSSRQYNPQHSLCLSLTINRRCNHRDDPPCSRYLNLLCSRLVILLISHPLDHRSSRLYNFLHTLRLNLTLNRRRNHTNNPVCSQYLNPVNSRQEFRLIIHPLGHRSSLSFSLLQSLRCSLPINQRCNHHDNPVYSRHHNRVFSR